MLVVAHRGARNRAPENTLDAFRAAIDDGAAAIEFDVLVTADHVPVVCHDDNLQRVSGTPACISNMTIDEVRAVDVSRSYDAWKHRAQIPLLEEVLTEFGSQAHLYVELKAALDVQGNFRSSLVPARASWPLLQGRSDVTVSSFDPAGTGYIQEMSNGAISIAHSVGAFDTSMAFLDSATQLGARQIHMDKGLINAARMTATQGGGFEVLAFTVNDPKEVAPLAMLGVHGIFTDSPGPMLAALGQ